MVCLRPTAAEILAEDTNMNTGQRASTLLSRSRANQVNPSTTGLFQTSSTSRSRARVTWSRTPSSSRAYWSCSRSLLA